MAKYKSLQTKSGKFKIGVYVGNGRPPRFEFLTKAKATDIHYSYSQMMRSEEEIDELINLLFSGKEWASNEGQAPF